MAIGDLYTLTLNWNVFGDSCTFSQDYKQTAGSNDENTLRLACVEFKDNQAVEFMKTQVADADLDQIKMCPIAGVDEIPGCINYDGVTGTIVSDPLPSNVAMVLSQLTNAPNSNANGRIFLAGMPEVNMDTGILDAAYGVIAQVFADSLLDDLDVTGPPTATFVPVVISRFLDGIKRVSPVAHDLISVAVKLATRQQRRRTTRRVGLST